eukprot:scaffold171_cov92-Cylindrotheca_fusiformis.AAC.1
MGATDTPLLRRKRREGPDEDVAEQSLHSSFMERSIVNHFDSSRNEIPLTIFTETRVFSKVFIENECLQELAFVERRNALFGRKQIFQFLSMSQILRSDRVVHDPICHQFYTTAMIVPCNKKSKNAHLWAIEKIKQHTLED